jgi:drug/metabolite transporter (DMT)-like permease
MPQGPTMGELLALTAAACFGITDFVSGLLSRRAPGMTVSLYGQLGGTALSILIATAWPATAPRSAAPFAWAALSGLGTGVGVAFLFRAMGTGAMSVAVPISAVGGVALPVLVGLVLLGDRPSAVALVGVAVALPAIWLVSGPHTGPGRTRRAAGVPDALVSSAGFAVQFIAMAQVGLTDGMWPLVLSRVASVVVIAVLVARTGVCWTMPRLPAAAAMASGVIGTAAIVSYLLATSRQLLTIPTVLASLYPAVPVLLAVTVLRERLSTRQIVGLVVAGAAIGLVTA